MDLRNPQTVLRYPERRQNQNPRVPNAGRQMVKRRWYKLLYDGQFWRRKSWQRWLGRAALLHYQRAAESVRRRLFCFIWRSRKLQHIFCLCRCLYAVCSKTPLSLESKKQNAEKFRNVSLNIVTVLLTSSAWTSWSETTGQLAKFWPPPQRKQRPESSRLRATGRVFKLSFYDLPRVEKSESDLVGANKDKLMMKWRKDLKNRKEGETSKGRKDGKAVLGILAPQTATAAQKRLNGRLLS